MVVGCHQQPTIAAIFFDNGSHIIGNIPTISSVIETIFWRLTDKSSCMKKNNVVIPFKPLKRGKKKLVCL
jgi:hypothetical protein